MPSDNVALFTACFSGAVSLTAALAVDWLRRRGNREIEGLRNAQAEGLETLKAEQATALEHLRAAQATELARTTDQLARTREAASKADEAASVVAKYRDPLLRSAYDLQSRIFNVYRPGGFTGVADPQYFLLNTQFLLAEFLGWLEIIRREMQFLDLGAIHDTKELSQTLHDVQDRLAATSELRDDIYLYRGHQRAIGELMLTRVDERTSVGPRYECMGYAAFITAHDDPAFAKWFTRLGDAIDRLRHNEKPERLVWVQRALIELIDLLDPKNERFEGHRGRLPEPETPRRWSQRPATGASTLPTAHGPR